MENDLAIEEDAYQWLRGHLSGFLRFDGERVAIKIAPMPDGTFVASVMVAMLMAADTVLELPDDGENDLHLMVSLEKFDEREDANGCADRWRTYHGDPPDVNWAHITIDAVKFRGYFIDGEVFLRPNVLATDESAICRTINRTKRDGVSAAIFAQFHADAENALVVGVDATGLDVRRQFDVLRLRAPAECVISDETTALEALKSLTQST